MKVIYIKNNISTTSKFFNFYF